MKAETMTAIRLDGNALARKIKDEIRDEIIRLQQSTGAVPHLVNIMLGMDPSACSYANSQKRVAADVGIQYDLVNLPLDISQESLIEKISQFNDDRNIHGIMIHKPVPKTIDYRTVANCLDGKKDVEGINVTNIGKMLLGETQLIPCTPAAVMEHIFSTKVSLRGKEAVIIGASEIVGKPLSLLLLRQDATVCVCHVATSEAGRLQEHIRRAEILIVAVGKAEFIKGEWIKEGAIVIDVGINQFNNKIVGDVEFEKAQEKASYITPVPGGVGPVTVVMLMRNGLEAYKNQVSSNNFFSK